MIYKCQKKKFYRNQEIKYHSFFNTSLAHASMLVKDAKSQRTISMSTGNV